MPFSTTFIEVEAFNLRTKSQERLSASGEARIRALVGVDTTTDSNASEREHKTLLVVLIAQHLGSECRRNPILDGACGAVGPAAGTCLATDVPSGASLLLDRTLALGGAPPCRPGLCISVTIHGF